MSASAAALSRSWQAGRYLVTLDISKPIDGRCRILVGWSRTDLAPGEVPAGQPDDLTEAERLAYETGVALALFDARQELGGDVEVVP